MEEESWRNHEGGIMEKESWRRNHGGGTLEEESWRRDLGGIWEASGRLLGAQGGTQRHPRRHPGGTQGSPGGQRRLGGKVCQNICVFSDKSCASDLLACTGATRPSRSPQQGSKSWRTRTWELGASHTPKSLREAARNPTVEHCLGN